MASYDDGWTLREGRARYFAANGFGERGYDQRWVKLQAGPIPLYLPNTKARVAAVRLHDLHHVLTGYDTTWTGEAEIAAWEIASGCGRYHAAWLLNLQALAIGLCLDGPAMLRAFVRGRYSTSLYGTVFNDSLLEPRIGDARAELGLDRDPPAPTPWDRMLFGLWSAASLATLLASAAAVLAPLVAIVRLVLR